MKSFIDNLKSLLGLPGGRPVTFQDMFIRFRQVLGNHNRAIELIADMGEKLGGDYLFDIEYVKSAYAELFRTLSGSLADFDVLTRNRYHHLREVFDRIDREIRRLLSDEASSAGRLIVPYEEITWDMAHEVGGKNANLAELKNSRGINVPDAFAITTHAFDEFIRHNGLEEKIKALSSDHGSNGLNSSNSSSGKAASFAELRDLVIRGETPAVLGAAIHAAVDALRARHGNDRFLAVRSSADEEDGEFSFAGQFETVLNVPLEAGAVEEAYKKVVASLFSDKAAAYRRRLGRDVRGMKMAAGCLLMVEATSSGVMYTADVKGGGDTLMITSAWGLGASVVEGRTETDSYLVTKDAVPEIKDKKTGRKTSRIVNRKGGGTDVVTVPPGDEEKESLTASQVLALALQGIEIEKHFRKPQDIEWTIDREGGVFFLQARPLRIDDSRGQVLNLDISPKDSKSDIPESAVNVKIQDLTPALKIRGIAAQQGAGAGRVFILRHMDQLDNFPKGAVLVSKHDSSNFVRIMPYVAAIITDVGTLTSHMASICREFRVPALVNAGNATQVLRHGQEITADIDDGGEAVIYEGTVREVLDRAASRSMRMEDVYEFRKKRYVLRYISPLNLVDPLLDNFTPGGCKTMHDVLRFIHEKSVMELVESSRQGLKGHTAKKLDLPIPAGIMVVDIGGGLAAGGSSSGQGRTTFEQVASLPFRAVLRGMMHPGAWHSETVPLRAGDFLSSMMRMPDIRTGNGEYAGYNIAVVSREYMNLSLRFGYHFNMLDCYCSENTRNNHLYFRFAGGATDMTKRSRRIQLISIILNEYGFSIRTKGDLIIGRLANIGQDELERILDQIGRLIAYTRQLDAVLHDDGRVEEYAGKFLQGDYGL